MQLGWQELVALMVVALAAGYLARRSWRLLGDNQTGGCGSCSGCSAPTAQRDGDVISIEALVESAQD